MTVCPSSLFNDERIWLWTIRWENLTKYFQFWLSTLVHTKSRHDPNYLKLGLYIHFVLAPINNSDNSMCDTNFCWIEICEIYSDQSQIEIGTVLVRGWNNTSQAESRGKIILSLILLYDWVKPLDKIERCKLNNISL